MRTNMLVLGDLLVATDVHVSDMPFEEVGTGHNVKKHLPSKMWTGPHEDKSTS